MCDEKTPRDWARYLEDAPRVSRRRFGALTAGAGASFHGGNLVTDSADSPHLVIPKMSAALLIAIAGNDDMADPEAKTTLRETFAAAGLVAEAEVYDGAQHGWCVPDSAVYHEVQAERAWDRLPVLFERAFV